MSYVDDLIEFCLMHRDDIATAVEEKRQDPGGGGHTGGSGSGHSYVSDPTAIQGIKAALSVPCVYVAYGATVCGKRDAVLIRQPERWLKVVDKVAAYCLKSSDTKEFYHHRYILREDHVKTCHDLNLSRGAYYAKKANVIRLAENLAIGFGCLSPYCRMGKII